MIVDQVQKLRELKRRRFEQYLSQALINKFNVLVDLDTAVKCMMVNKVDTYDVQYNSYQSLKCWK